MPARQTAAAYERAAHADLALVPHRPARRQPARRRSPSCVPRPPAARRRGAAASCVRWARHQDEVRAAQRLRHAVFAGEMGARLATPVPGHDIDLFDDFCEHLLVRDEADAAR